ncbi:MAG: endonuclease domain-containing protein [Leifsonia sp.]|uniref:endonuclease domain-containing protein n=1 Tax=Leifsonia sp. TaxID=1870902 RepID=UPI003F7E58F7
MPRSRLRAADLARPVRGFRVPADAELAQRCRALRLHRSDLAFSHSTALELYGAPLPARMRRDPRIHVTVAAPTRAPQIHGVAGHVTRSIVVRSHRGLPVIAPEQSWLDAAAMLTRPDLVAVGDYFVAHGFATPASLETALAASRGRRGLSVARLALPLIRAGAESPSESLLRVLLHDAGLPPSALNVNVFDLQGRFVARVDLAYEDQRIAVEYEGDHHRTDRAQWHKDIHRQGRLEDLGWRVIRVTASDLATPATLLTRVRRALGLER